MRLVATLTTLLFAWSSVSDAQPPILSPATAKAPGVDFALQDHLHLPSGLGSVEQEYRAEEGSPFIIYIQDAHAIWDAQNNIHGLIQYFQQKFGINLIAVEGATGELDPLLFRTFPDSFIKKRIFKQYLDRGELSGADMAAVFDPAAATYYGIEDWGLYEQNHLAYLRAMQNQEAILQKLHTQKLELDQKRKEIYSPELNALHEKGEAFQEEKLHLIELLRYLRDLEKEKPLPFERYPYLAALSKSITEDSQQGQEDIDISIRRMAEVFKKKYLGRLDKKQIMQFQEMHQNYATGQMDAGSFLTSLIEMGNGIGVKPKMTPRMRELLRNYETLAIIKGTKLFDELEEYLAAVYTRLIKTPGQKELSEKYQRLRLFKDLANLELTRDQLEEIGDGSQFQDEIRTVPEIAEAFVFYRLALERDQVFTKNLADLIKEKNVRSAIVLTGGFHAKGFEANLREQGYSYAVVMPKIQSLAGKETYQEVMEGKVSYKEYFKTTFYDAFVRHSTIQLMGALNEPDFRRNLKQWRDNIIRQLASEKRVDRAHEYTRYLDLLIKTYYDRFGTGKISREELLKALEGEWQRFQKETTDNLWNHFQSQLKAFTEGLQSLIQRKELTVDKMALLRDQISQSPPVALAPAHPFARNPILRGMRKEEIPAQVFAIQEKPLGRPADLQRTLPDEKKGQARTRDESPKVVPFESRAEVRSYTQGEIELGVNRNAVIGFVFENDQLKLTLTNKTTGQTVQLGTANFYDKTVSIGIPPLARNKIVIDPEFAKGLGIAENQLEFRFERTKQNEPRIYLKNHDTLSKNSILYQGIALLPEDGWIAIPLFSDASEYRAKRTWIKTAVEVLALEGLDVPWAETGITLGDMIQALNEWFSSTENPDHAIFDVIRVNLRLHLQLREIIQANGLQFDKSLAAYLRDFLQAEYDHRGRGEVSSLEITRKPQKPELKVSPKPVSEPKAVVQEAQKKTEEEDQTIVSEPSSNISRPEIIRPDLASIIPDSGKVPPVKEYESVPSHEKAIIMSAPDFTLPERSPPEGSAGERALSQEGSQKRNLRWLVGAGILAAAMTAGVVALWKASQPQTPASVPTTEKKEPLRSEVRAYENILELFPDAKLDQRKRTLEGEFDRLAGKLQTAFFDNPGEYEELFRFVEAFTNRFKEIRFSQESPEELTVLLDEFSMLFSNAGYHASLQPFVPKNSDNLLRQFLNAFASRSRSEVRSETNVSDTAKPSETGRFGARQVPRMPAVPEIPISGRSELREAGQGKGDEGQEGLCVTGDTQLPVIREKTSDQRPETGDQELELIPIREVKPRSDYVLSLNESTQEIEPRRILALLDMGVKPVYRLITASGRSIKTTANHPYLVKLKRGQSPEKAEKGPVPFSRKKSAWIKVSELKVGDEIAVANEFNGGDDAFAADSPNTSSRTKQSSVPQAQLTFQSLFASFRRIIYNAKEDKEKKESTKKNTYPKGEVFKKVTRQPDREDRFRQVGQKPYNKFLLLQSQWFHKTYPGENNNGKLHKSQLNFDEFLIPFNALLNRISTAVGLQIAEASSLPSTSSLPNDVLWDRIVSIEPVGYEHVYDIEVEGTHNFVGNGIFAHNTAIPGSFNPRAEVRLDPFDPSTAQDVRPSAARSELRVDPMDEKLSDAEGEISLVIGPSQPLRTKNLTELELDMDALERAEKILSGLSENLNQQQRVKKQSLETQITLWRDQINARHHEIIAHPEKAFLGLRRNKAVDILHDLFKEPHFAFTLEERQVLTSFLKRQFLSIVQASDSEKMAEFENQSLLADRLVNQEMIDKNGWNFERLHAALDPREFDQIRLDISKINKTWESRYQQIVRFFGGGQNPYLGSVALYGFTSFSLGTLPLGLFGLLSLSTFSILKDSEQFFVVVLFAFSWFLFTYLLWQPLRDYGLSHLFKNPSVGDEVGFIPDPRQPHKEIVARVVATRFPMILRLHHLGENGETVEREVTALAVRSIPQYRETDPRSELRADEAEIAENLLHQLRQNLNTENEALIKNKIAETVSNQSEEYRNQDLNPRIFIESYLRAFQNATNLEEQFAAIKALQSSFYYLSPAKFVSGRYDIISEIGQTTRLFLDLFENPGEGGEEIRKMAEIGLINIGINFPWVLPDFFKKQASLKKRIQADQLHLLMLNIGASLESQDKYFQKILGVVSPFTVAMTDIDFEEAATLYGLPKTVEDYLDLDLKVKLYLGNVRAGNNISEVRQNPEVANKTRVMILLWQELVSEMEKIESKYTGIHQPAQYMAEVQDLLGHYLKLTEMLLEGNQIKNIGKLGNLLFSDDEALKKKAGRWLFWLSIFGNEVAQNAIQHVGNVLSEIQAEWIQQNRELDEKYKFRSELRPESRDKRSSPFWGSGTPLGTGRSELRNALGTDHDEEIGQEKDRDQLKDIPFGGQFFWIGAGDFFYQISVEGSNLRIKQQDKSRKTKIQKGDLKLDQEYRVGREEKMADLVFEKDNPKSRLSRLHFSFKVVKVGETYQLSVVDLKSKNKTRVFWNHPQALPKPLRTPLDFNQRPDIYTVDRFQGGGEKDVRKLFYEELGMFRLISHPDSNETPYFRMDKRTGTQETEYVLQVWAEDKWQDVTNALFKRDGRSAYVIGRFEIHGVSQVGILRDGDLLPTSLISGTPRFKAAKISRGHLGIMALFDHTENPLFYFLDQSKHGTEIERVKGVKNIHKEADMSPEQQTNLEQFEAMIHSINPEKVDLADLKTRLSIDYPALLIDENLRVTRNDLFFNPLLEGGEDAPGTIDEIAKALQDVLKELESDPTVRDFLKQPKYRWRMQYFFDNDAMSYFVFVMQHVIYEQNQELGLHEAIRQYLWDQVNLTFLKKTEEELNLAEKYAKAMRQKRPQSKPAVLYAASREDLKVVVEGKAGSEDPNAMVVKKAVFQLGEGRAIPRRVQLDIQEAESEFGDQRPVKVLRYQPEKVLFAELKGRTFMFYVSRSHTVKGASVHTWRQAEGFLGGRGWIIKQKPENFDDLPPALALALDEALVSIESEIPKKGREEFLKQADQLGLLNFVYTDQLEEIYGAENQEKLNQLLAEFSASFHRDEFFSNPQIEKALEQKNKEFAAASRSELRNKEGVRLPAWAAKLLRGKTDIFQSDLLQRRSTAQALARIKDLNPGKLAFGVIIDGNSLRHMFGRDRSFFESYVKGIHLRVIRYSHLLSSLMLIIIDINGYYNNLVGFLGKNGPYLFGFIGSFVPELVKDKILAAFRFPQLSWFPLTRANRGNDFGFIRPTIDKLDSSVLTESNRLFGFRHEAKLSKPLNVVNIFQSNNSRRSELRPESRDKRSSPFWGSGTLLRRQNPMVLTQENDSKLDVSNPAGRSVRGESGERPASQYGPRKPARSELRPEIHISGTSKHLGTGRSEMRSRGRDELIKIYAEKGDFKKTLEITGLLSENNLRKGSIPWSFPLPGNRNLRKVQQLKIGENLKRVEMTVIHKEGEYEFIFTQVSEKGERSRESHWRVTDKGLEEIIQEEEEKVRLKRQEVEQKLKNIYSRKDAFEETVEITGLLSESNLRVGTLSRSFPLPGGRNLGKNQYIKIGQNLNRVDMTVIHKEGEYELIFTQVTEKDEASRQSHWRVTADGLEEIIQDEEEKIRLKKQEIEQKLKSIYLRKDAFEETVEITGLLSENVLREGKLTRSFPLPGERNLGKNQSMKIGTNLKRVDMSVIHKGGEYEFIFMHVTEKGEKSSQSHWRVTDEGLEEIVQREEAKMRLTKQGMEQKLKDIYSRKDAFEETVEISGLLSENDLRQGKLPWSFPLPGDRNLGNKQSLKIGQNLKQVDMSVIHKGGEYEFIFMHVTEKGERSSQSHWRVTSEGLVEVTVDKVLEAIDNLGLAEVIALLGADPLRLQQYLRLYYPELSQENLDQIAIHALEGLKADWTEKEELHLDYEETLPRPEVNQDREATEGHSFTLRGKVQAGIPYIQVTRAYTRRIVVRQDGSFSASIPLPKTGEMNLFQVYSFDPEKYEKSPPVALQVQQIGNKESLEESFLRLLALKEDILKSIQKDPVRYSFLLRSVELTLLRHFTYNEEAGFNVLESRIHTETSATQKAILEAVLKKFRTIQKLNFNLKPGERLYFFQKYTIARIRELMEAKAPGVIIANEQGLGKTVTALAAINGQEAVILTPNSVVSTWAEQEEQFFPTPNLEILEGSYQAREIALKALNRPQVVTNIEFTRSMTDKKANLLSRPQGVLIIDEADYLGSKASQQAKGTRQLEAGFKLLLTATPFKQISQIGNLLEFLHLEELGWGSAKAFARAFQTGDQEALNALFLLMQNHTIRIRKKDVFETIDPNLPLNDQPDRLPRKVEVTPDQEGGFELTKAQSESILELFTDYESWSRKHKGNESLEDQHYYRYTEGYFSKKEALRQMMNDPVYIGKPEIESPKHLVMDQIVEKELAAKKDRKLLIFTRYRAQVEAYLKRYSKYGARAYYGGLKANANGYKVDENGNVLYYKVDDYENFVLENGKLILTEEGKGRPVRALDYERILFQNDPSSRILIATYDTGSVGVTLTAADAVIFDDLAPTYRDEYQAGDRAHRIDKKRGKAEVKYYWLQGRYPKSFLDKLPQEIRDKYFSVGTFDEVHYQNLRRQGRIFHRIMDGVGSDKELASLDQRFMKEKMPFLFTQGEPDETPFLSQEPGEENPPSPKKYEEFVSRSELRVELNIGDTENKVFNDRVDGIKQRIENRLAKARTEANAKDIDFYTRMSEMFQKEVEPYRSNLKGFLQDLARHQFVTSEFQTLARSVFAREAGISQEQIVLISSVMDPILLVFFGLADPALAAMTITFSPALKIIVIKRADSPTQDRNMEDLRILLGLAHETSHVKQSGNRLHRQSLFKILIEGFQKQMEYEILLKIAQENPLMAKKMEELINHALENPPAFDQIFMPQRTSAIPATFPEKLKYVRDNYISVQSYISEEKFVSRLIKIVGETAVRALWQGDTQPLQEALGASKFEALKNFFDFWFKSEALIGSKESSQFGSHVFALGLASKLFFEESENVTAEGWTKRLPEALEELSQRLGQVQDKKTLGNLYMDNLNKTKAFLKLLISLMQTFIEEKMDKPQYQEELLSLLSKTGFDFDKPDSPLRSELRLARQEPSTAQDVRPFAARSAARQVPRMPAVPKSLDFGRSELRTGALYHLQVRRLDYRLNLQKLPSAAGQGGKLIIYTSSEEPDLKKRESGEYYDHYEAFEIDLEKNEIALKISEDLNNVFTSKKISFTHPEENPGEYRDHKKNVEEFSADLFRYSLVLQKASDMSNIPRKESWFLSEASILVRDILNEAGVMPKDADIFDISRSEVRPNAKWKVDFAGLVGIDNENNAQKLVEDVTKNGLDAVMAKISKRAEVRINVIGKSIRDAGERILEPLRARGLAEAIAAEVWMPGFEDRVRSELRDLWVDASEVDLLISRMQAVALGLDIPEGIQVRSEAQGDPVKLAQAKFFLDQPEVFAAAYKEVYGRDVEMQTTEDLIVHLALLFNFNDDAKRTQLKQMMMESYNRVGVIAPIQNGLGSLLREFTQDSQGKITQFPDKDMTEGLVRKQGMNQPVVMGQVSLQVDETLKDEALAVADDVLLNDLNLESWQLIRLLALYRTVPELIGKLTQTTGSGIRIVNRDAVVSAFDFFVSLLAASKAAQEAFQAAA